MRSAGFGGTPDDCKGTDNHYLVVRVCKCRNDEKPTA